MDEPADSAYDALFEHRGWLRELARRLVKDSEAADDLAQETWLAALRCPPPDDRPIRRWLALVLRNFARQRHRREQSRRRAEIESAESAERPALEQAVERLNLHRQLVDALAALDEPYRSTLLLRFYQELSPRQISDVQAVPLKTVYARLERGLARLREELDRRSNGDRRQWLSALVACFELEATPRAAPRRSSPRGVPASARLGAALLLATAAGVLLFVALRSPLVRETLAEAEPARAAPAAPVSVATAGEEPSASRAEADPRAELDPREAAPAAQPESNVSGRVLDFSGRAIPGVRVVALAGAYPGSRTLSIEFVPSAEPPLAAAETDARGSFEMSVANDAVGCLALESAAWVAVLRARLSPLDRGRERVLVAEPRRPLAGSVTDDAGAPIAGAEVRIELPSDAGSGLSAKLHDEELEGLPTPRTHTDELGGFELSDAFRLAGAHLLVTAGGCEPARVELSSDLGDFAALVLRRASSALRGRVVHADGSPCEGAYVSSGDEVVRSGSEGVFALHAQPGAERLVAALAGSQPAMVAPERDASGATLWPEPLELVLGGPALALHGRVVATDGAPIAGAWVWVADPTLFGRGERTHFADEAFPVHLEGLIGGWPEFWNRVPTDSDGRFAIGGLQDREYSVHAVHRATLALGRSARVRAGTAELVEIEIALDDVHARAAGRALAPDGRPLAGVQISVHRDVLSLAAPWRRRPFALSYISEQVVTGADGAFALRPFARDGIFLRATGADFDAFVRHLAPGDDVLALELVVPQRARVVVEHAAASAFELVDADGLPLTLRDAQSSAQGPRWRAPVEGRSLEYTVSEAARALVLFRGEEVLATLPVELAAGELNLLP